MSTQEFEQADAQVMKVVNDHASPEAAENAEQIARDVGARIVSGADCAPSDAQEPWYGEEECGNIPVETAHTCGVSKKALRQEQRYHRRCWLKALWRLIITELLGYAALGGVLLAGMVMEVVPVAAAVPVFVACFMWVAVRFDRWHRG